MRTYEQSDNWLTRALAVTPQGSQTLSKRASNWPVGAYPAFVLRGRDARFIDIDGNEFIDWSCALGALSLGYGDEYVTDAVVMALRAGGGPSYSLPHRLEVTVAEELAAAVGRAGDQVRWVKSGSEATEAAIRVARSYTRRDVILTVKGGYHSWHSWFAATRDVRPGVPALMQDMVWTFDYNDLERLTFLFQLGTRVDHPSIAAVIMEPCLLTPPNAGFLQGVRNLCSHYGALLIFDEVLTGFRWARGGGAEFFGVQPDLQCFGKAIANGFPLGALIGPPKIMQHASVVSGTFGGDTCALAACGAVIERFMTDNIIGANWAIGNHFADGLKELLSKYDLPARIDGYGIHPRLTWMHEHPSINRYLMSLWLQTLGHLGIHLHPSGWNVMAAHTERDVTESLMAAAAACRMLQHSIRDQNWSQLRGALIDDNPFRPGGA